MFTRDAPTAKELPINPYLEYAYGGLLYACSTVGGNWIYKIHPDGTVEQVVQHGECEGLIYGDRGDGVERLYASNYTNATIAMIGEDNSRTVVVTDPLKLPISVDLAIPTADSAFPPGSTASTRPCSGSIASTPRARSPSTSRTRRAGASDRRAIPLRRSKTTSQP